MPKRSTYQNSPLAGLLRACAVENPPKRSELLRELRDIGLPPALEDDALAAAEKVAASAAYGRVGARKGQARMLADQLGERLWATWQADDALVPHHDPDDTYDPEADAAEANARIRSGIRAQGGRRSTSPKPPVPWKQ